MLETLAKSKFYSETLKAPQAVLAPMAGYSDAPFHGLALELVKEYGWTPEEYKSWLAETLKRQLL